jgi:CDP-glucose 4,6-dehydratase
MIKESNLLKLNCNKAKKTLGWQPVLNFKETVRYTSLWYNSFQKTKNIDQITHKQIQNYYELAISKNLLWIK